MLAEPVVDIQTYPDQWPETEGKLRDPAAESDETGGSPGYQNANDFGERFKEFLIRARNTWIAKQCKVERGR
jgi:hypothetical protein